MRIAVCDDESRELVGISSLLEEYRQEKKTGLFCETFSSAVELLAVMETTSFDLLLLDIMMPELSGMQAAHEIRSFDEIVKIVFLTASPEFAVESYVVGAYGYLLKPITRETLFPVLDKLVNEERRAAVGSENEYFTVKCRTGMVRVALSRLSYVEVLGKSLFFHMSNGMVYETVATLSQYEKLLLARPEFYQVHRAFLVNLWQMRELTSRDFITLNGEVVPVSRRYYLEVRDAFMKSLFSKEERRGDN